MSELQYHHTPGNFGNEYLANADQAKRRGRPRRVCSRCQRDSSDGRRIRNHTGNTKVCDECVPKKGLSPPRPQALTCTASHPHLNARIALLVAIVDTVRANGWRESDVRAMGLPASVSDVPFDRFPPSTELATVEMPADARDCEEDD